MSLSRVFIGVGTRDGELLLFFSEDREDREDADLLVKFLAGHIEPATQVLDLRPAEFGI